MALLLALGIATQNVPGFRFESGLLLLLALLMVATLIVFAFRPPTTRLQPQSLIVRRLGSSLEIDRDHFLGYSIRRALRVAGGEFASSNRSLFVSYKGDDGSENIVPACWSYRWLGLRSAKEQAVAEKDLDHWRSEVSASRAS
jgi:hypothetical protein